MKYSTIIAAFIGVASIDGLEAIKVSKHHHHKIEKNQDVQ